MKPWMMVVVAIVSGCVGAAATKLVIPPARAQNVQRWEHLCANSFGKIRNALPEDIQATANRVGSEGWEMVSIDAGIHCYKRPLP